MTKFCLYFCKGKLLSSFFDIYCQMLCLQSVICRPWAVLDFFSNFWIEDPVLLLLNNIQNSARSGAKFMRTLIAMSAHKDLLQILHFCQLPFTKGKKFVLPLLLFSTFDKSPKSHWWKELPWPCLNSEARSRWIIPCQWSEKKAFRITK